MHTRTPYNPRSHTRRKKRASVVEDTYAVVHRQAKRDRRRGAMSGGGERDMQAEMAPKPKTFKPKAKEPGIGFIPHRGTFRPTVPPSLR